MAATGVSRGGIYTDFGGKEELYLACLDAYRQKYADPALALLRSNEDGLAGIDAYFEHFIRLHRQHGMPGPGCFLANAMTELAPHDAMVRDVVNQHSEDLREAFLSALNRLPSARRDKRRAHHRNELAGFLATASQGLWSYGRSTPDIGELESFKKVLLNLLNAKLGTSLKP